MFDEAGYLLVTDVLGLSTVERLRVALESAGESSQRGESVYARRNILVLPEVQAVAADPRVLALTGAATTLTRAIFFDKVPGANWHVGWHQDRAIAVTERIELPGWGPWSTKAGVLHVLPPAEILEKMVTVRLHLDPCDETNGPLRVLPGSHRQGILSSEQIAALREQTAEVICTGPVGSAVVMSPLLLHASSPAQSPSHRRILHLEFAPEKLLPEGLCFASACLLASLPPAPSLPLRPNFVGGKGGGVRGGTPPPRPSAPPLLPTKEETEGEGVGQSEERAEAGGSVRESTNELV
ncbi:phytanoyl-CoA dioxygenase family protein [Armatimonas rosea]|uniref:Phytanoyl-CoA dioxygenase n=1 Tax=Armatimonas rosea TaxID=685828 RepID=A0A7W9SMI0_ARMRO|nr:phytanoyl-CoA dioxygenase family protein [Armatimonas rosea]MBB6049372.1 hypothetical protein [Armatimonas rosea]